MPRRTLITASLLVLLLAVIALLPSFPPVRGFIVDRVVGALGDAGIDVTYDSTGGNAWRGVTLDGVSILGAGSDVDVDRLRVGYFLPSLLGGELPIDVTVSGASGNVDLQEILDEAIAPPASGQGRSISVRLRRLDLEDIDVDVEQLPFTLPDTKLRELAVSQDGTNLLLSGVLITPDGEAVVDGRYESLTGSATVQVERADAAIGRHWWDGITGGEVTGELRLRGSSVEGDFVLQGGSVADAGLNAEGVGGTVSLRLPVITADLSGTAFGGPVEANGVVNVEARRWEANGTANPGLGDAADWLARSQFPDGLPVEVTGTSEVTLSLAGWQDFTLDGAATGQGAVEDVPLDDLQVTFRLPADGELRADGTALLGGGPVDFSMAPSTRGGRLTLTAQGVGLEAIQAGLGELDLDLDIGTGPGGTGTITAQWEGALGGRSLNAVVDASLDSDGLQGFIRGGDGTGLEAEGAFVLADGRLQGRLSSGQLGLDALSPGARVAVAVDGPVSDGLDGLGVTLSVDGDQPVRLTALPEQLATDFDLRGDVTGVLDLAGAEGPAVRGLAGSLGPLNVGGEVVFSPLRARMEVSTGPVPFQVGTTEAEAAGAAPAPASTANTANSVSAVVSVTGSTLVVDSGGVAWNGNVAYRDASAGPARLPPGTVDANFSLPNGEPWRLVANSRTGDVTVTADAGGFEVDLAEFDVLLGDEAAESGGPAEDGGSAVGVGPANGVSSDAMTAAAVSGNISGRLDLRAEETQTRIAVDLTVSNADGYEVEFPLPGVLDLAGDIDLAGSQATLVGGLTFDRSGTQPLTSGGSVPLETTVAWGDAGASATVVIGSTTAQVAEPLTATFEAESGRFSLSGTANLGEFITATDARLTADLSGLVTAGGVSDLQGNATLTGTRPTAFEAEVEGAGSEALVNVSAGTDALPVTATGSIDLSSFEAVSNSGDALLNATVGPFSGIAIGLQGASGSGTLEETALGPLLLPPLPWTLTASWAGGDQPSATVELAGSPLTLTLAEGGLEVVGAVEVPVSYGGESYLLEASVPGGLIDLSDLRSTPVAGTLTHAGAAEVLTITGTLAELQIDGTIPTAQLAAMLPADSRPPGLLTITGTVAPLDGPSYSADLELVAELPPDARQALPAEAVGETTPVTLTGRVSGVGANVSAELAGNGLTFTLQNGVLDVVADDARLEPLVGLPGSIDGTLTLDESSNWGGTLTIEAGLDMAEPVSLMVELEGGGKTLGVSAQASGPAEARLEAAGTLAPAVSLTGRVEAGGGIVNGTLDYSSQSGLTAEFASPELLVEDYLTIPPLTVTMTLAPGENLLLRGSGIDVRADLASGAISGAVEVPFTLLDSPARLDAAVSGTLSDPQAQAVVTGEGLRIDASGDLETARADLRLDPAVAATFVPAAAPLTSSVDEPVLAVAQWRSDGGWDLRAVATATLPTTAGTTPAAGDEARPAGAGDEAQAASAVELELNLSGGAATYTGELAVYLDDDRDPAPTAEAGGEATVRLSPVPRTATGKVASVEIAGTGGDLAAELDLASVGWNAIGASLGLDLDLQASGAATLTTQPFQAALDVELAGTVEGIEVRLSGSAPDDLDLTLTSDEVVLTARLAWNEQRKAVIEGTVGGQSVTGWLELADNLRTGRLSLDTPGATVEARLSTVQAGAPTAPAVRHVVVEGRLKGELPGVSAGESAGGSAGGALGGVAGDLSAELTILDGAVELTSLLAEVDRLPGLEPPPESGPQVRLTASGSIAPQAAVSGTLELPPLGESARFTVAPTDGDGGLAASLAWQGLDLAYVLAERHFTLTGQASLGAELSRYLPAQLAGLEASIESTDLTWSPAAGFGGAVTAQLDAPLLDDYGVEGPVSIRGVAAGGADGQPAPLVLTADLALTPPIAAANGSSEADEANGAASANAKKDNAAASASAGESATATASVTLVVPGDLAPPAQMPLTGTLTAAATLPAQGQRITVNAEVAGSFGAPVLEGTVTAEGPIEAAGRVEFADGRGSFDLAGPHLEVAAVGGLEEWTASASVTELPLDEWLPQVEAPTLTFDASASSGGGGATVDGLRLEAGASRLTGAATITGGVRVALQAQVDLADLQLGGTELTGLLRGPMVLTAASLAELADANITAQLDGAGIGVESVDAAVSGVLQVGGRFSDPTINALLTGSGDLSGTLRVDAAPSRGRLELRSTLAAGALSSNLRVSITPELTSASGQARYGDAVLLLADGPQGIELLGAGRIDGWSAVIAPDRGEVTASGPLSAVSPSLGGEVDLVLGGRDKRPAGEPWLLATVSAPVVAGQELPELRVTSQEPGAVVAVEGEGLALSLSPADLGWTLALDGFALPGSLDLALSGTGKGASGRVEGTLVSGAPAGLDLAFTASLGAAQVAPPAAEADQGAEPVDTPASAQATISVEGEALGGRLFIDGARAANGSWTGDVVLAGASVAGFDLSGNGVLQGQTMLPQAVIATAALSEAETPLSVVGRVSVGGSGISFDQTAALPMLAAPVRLQGSLYPAFDVTLAAAPAARSGDVAGALVPRGSTRLFATGAGLRASGEVVLPLGPVIVALGGSGPEASPQVEVRLAAAPSVAVQAPLVARDLPGLVELVSDGGLTFTGVDAAHGTVAIELEPALTANLDGFGVDLAGFALSLSGSVSPGDADLSGSLRLPLDLPAGAQAAGQELPLQVTTSEGRWSVTSSGDLGDLAASYDLAGSALQVDLDLALPTAPAAAEPGIDQGISSGAIVGRITYDPVNGPAGTLALADVRLAPVGIGEVTLNADTAIADGRLGGSATLDTAGGRVTLNGNADLGDLFPGLATAGPSTGGRDSNLELRLRTLALDEFPVIASLAPHLTGALSGVVQLRNGFLLGQIVAPDLAVGDQSVPASLQVSGPPSDLDAALQFAGSLFTADLGSGHIAGSSRLERFPLDLVGEAFVGPTDVTAFLTGVVRFDLPSTDPASGYVRLATEELTLERAGVTTRGEVALTYEDRHLTVQNAQFGGEGTWRAAGVLGPDLLDFTLEANDADFSPLIGLVPALSRFAVGAAGSFTFSAQGDFSAPEVSLDSDVLEVAVAGNRFRIEDTDVTLSGDDLAASTTIRGLEPLQGAIDFSGDATVMLEPLALRSVDFGFTGDLDVPGLGQVSGIRGTIGQDPQNLPVLFLTGDLGQPLTVQGTLLPLDLRASGDDLELTLPTLLIADATVDADLSLRSEEGGVVVGGAVTASEVIIDPAVRGGGEPAASPEAAAASEAGSGAPPTSATNRTTQAAASPAAASDPQTSSVEATLTDLPPIESAIEQLEPEDAGALPSTPSVAEAEAQGARNALAAVRFDDLRITAPQRVLLTMSIASLEASLDLTLAGTAAEPRLSGEASALRGSLRFAGREFTVDRAVASFTPNRGVLPELDVAAHADFEKTRVLAGSPDVEFAAPAEGNSFTVELAFTGPMELDEEGDIRFDIRPMLSSDALIEVSGEGVGTGVRPLTEAELLSLITLGRIEFGSDLIGAGGIGGAVAQGALDTAVDLLVVGELQNALREALGLDVVEIRTTAFSSLLGGEGAQPFGVSVRLGGYLNPDLFASYRIGTADPSDPGVGFTNEVALQYGLGPLNLDLLGRLDFPTAGTLGNPRPELGVGVSYDFGRALSVDTGVTLSTERSVVSFGVALRW